MLAGLLTGAIAGCSDPRPPPQPASFSRPTDVDFVCVGDGKLLRLEYCALDETARDGDLDNDNDVNNDGVVEEGERERDIPTRTLHAVVTQSARGEVAAVNLSSNRILDNRREVPGYTFVPTGELPIAIVVPKQKPERTYVANYGSRDIDVLRTDVLVSLSNDEPRVQRVSLGFETDAGAAGGTPSDMILTPSEDALLVTLPDVGQVVRLPLLEDGTIDEGAITTIELPMEAPATPVPVEADETYSLLCSEFEQGPFSSMLPATTAPAGAPRPVALALDESCDGDACEPRVLVADEALPVLHVLDVAALASGSRALLPSIPVGAPTRDVVVTPRVPKFVYEPAPKAPDEPKPDDAVFGGDTDAFETALAEYEVEKEAYDIAKAAYDERASASTYFVYAIDGDDGSVIALENDRVLAVNHDPASRADRLPIGGYDLRPRPNAVALEIITPLFDVHGGDAYQWAKPGASAAGSISDQYCTDAEHEEISPRRLRGVFLSVAMGDGSVRVVDVHDMEMGACRTCPDGVSAPALVRHHPRLSTDFIKQVLDPDDRETLQSRATAIYQSAGVTFSLRENGTTSTPDAPPLQCIACDSPLQQAFPNPEDQEVTEDDAGTDDADRSCPADRSAVICAMSNPWVLGPEELQFGFESVIPGTRGGDGRFVPSDDGDNESGALEFVGTIDFCNAGVLGNADIGAARDDSACSSEVTEAGFAAAMDPDTARSTAIAKGYALRGDQLVIRSEPLSDARLRELWADRLDELGDSYDNIDDVIDRCTRLRPELEGDKPEIVALEILAAFEDRLAISPAVIREEGSRLPLRSYLDVMACFGDGPFAFEVRTQNGFTVYSSRVGFAHGVATDDNGRCAVAPNASPLHTGRAWPGCEFKNERVQLKLGLLTEEDDGEEVIRAPERGVVFDTNVATNGGLLVLDARQPYRGVSSIVPARLRYSATNRQLYLVDTHIGGLIPITLDPFPNAPSTAFY